MGTKNKGVFGGPVNENNHPRGFVGLTGKTTALDNVNRVLLGTSGVCEYPAAALSLAPVGSSRVARLGVPTKRMASARPQVRGKFIFVGDEKFYVRGVTYGTFRANDEGEEFPAPEVVEHDFEQMAANGVNAVRTYTPPPLWLLDAAQRHGLRIMAGLPVER